MKLLLFGVAAAGLASSAVAERALSGGAGAVIQSSTTPPYSLGREFGSAVQKPSASQDLSSDHINGHTTGMDSTVTADIEAISALQGDGREGIRFSLSVKNRELKAYRVRYAVEVVDDFDTYYVGPEHSSVKASPNWSGQLDIPPGLPDGNYYLRVTIVGVKEGKLADDEQATFSIAKRQFFAVDSGRVSLLDWAQFQERLILAGDVDAKDARQ
jgi:hypothetical protein